jgi:hypothetical protein
MASWSSFGGSFTWGCPQRDLNRDLVHVEVQEFPNPARVRPKGQSYGKLALGAPKCGKQKGATVIETC